MIKQSVIVLTIAVMVLMCSATEAVGQADELIEWRISNQQQRLTDVEQWAATERQRIEQWYQDRLVELWLLAEDHAKRLSPAKRALWTRFIKTSNELPYAEAYFFDAKAYFFDSRVTRRHKGNVGLRIRLADSYFLTETTSFLLDEQAYRLLSWIADSDHQLSLVHKAISTETRKGLRRKRYREFRTEVRKILEIMDQLQSRRLHLEELRQIYIADVEQTERDTEEDIAARVSDIKAESKRPQVGLVTAICLDAKTPAVMIDGIEKDLIYEGQRVNNVRVVKIYSIGVEFEKNGRHWVQRIGQKPNSAW